MVNLMGLTVQDERNPDGDIPIEYTGLRPAEKLYEELLIGSDVTGTEHPRILRADERSLLLETLSDLVRELQDASAELDYNRARDVLSRAVEEYTPASGIDDLVWLSKNGKGELGDADTVVAFPGKTAS